MHIDEFLGQSREYLFKSHEQSAESCQQNESTEKSLELRSIPD
jgi:hypothetical protein